MAANMSKQQSPPLLLLLLLVPYLGGDRGDGVGVGVVLGGEGAVAGHVEPIQQTGHQEDGQTSDVQQRGENQEHHGFDGGGGEGDYLDGEVDGASEEDACAEEEDRDHQEEDGEHLQRDAGVGRVHLGVLRLPLHGTPPAHPGGHGHEHHGEDDARPHHHQPHRFEPQQMAEKQG